MERLMASYLELRSNWETLASQAPAFAAMAKQSHAASSAVHGIGLFASEDLPTGNLVTMYPIDALGDETSYLSFGKANQAHFGVSEKLRKQATGWYKVSLSHPSILRFADDLWIDANPTLRAQPGWLGHCVNDCATLPDDEDCSDAGAICSYCEEARARSNCVLVPLRFAL